MKRNLNKAFTLIELLAVIVILAIIALIATPIILGIVEDARKDSFERSVELVISTTDLDVASKNIQDGYMYEITDGTIPDLEIGIKNIEGMNGTIVYDKEGKEQYAIHNGQYCVMKTEGMDKAVISEYEEGSCKLVITTDSKYFTYEVLGPTYEIIDKEACIDVYMNEWSFLEEEATTMCNNEPIEAWGGMTLTETLANGFDPLAIKELLDAGAISYTGPEYEIIDKDACINFEMNVWEMSEEQATSECNNEPIEEFDGMTLTEVLPFFPPLDIKNLLDAGAIRAINAQLEITGYSEEGPKNVIIPSTIDGNTVVFIGSTAFANKSLTSVTIPETVTSIEMYAFANNNLNEQNINELEQKYQFSTVTPTDASCFTYEEVEGGISITDYQCQANDIVNVAIPNIIDGKEVVKIAKGAFAWDGLKSLVIPDTVTLIGQSAFYDNQITTLFIPDSVTSIGDSAFAYNSLTTLSIPDSVTSIGISAFASNPLTSVIIKNNNIILATGVFCEHNLSETSESYQKIYSINPDALNCPPPQ